MQQGLQEGTWVLTRGSMHRPKGPQCPTKVLQLLGEHERAAEHPASVACVRKLRRGGIKWGPPFGILAFARHDLNKLSKRYVTSNLGLIGGKWGVRASGGACSCAHVFFGMCWDSRL